MYQVCQNKIALASTDPLPTNMIKHHSTSRISHLNKVKVQIVINNALNVRVAGYILELQCHYSQSEMKTLY